MITVYFLAIETINNTEHVKGEQYIHDAILLTTEVPTIRQLIMDTTPEEDIALKALAISYRDPTQAEIDLYHTQVIIIPPDPDTLRAQELLHTSPDVITQPHIWELLRIIGRRLGYRFD